MGLKRRARGRLRRGPLNRLNGAQSGKDERQEETAECAWRRLLVPVSANPRPAILAECGDGALGAFGELYGEWAEWRAHRHDSRN